MNQLILDISENPVVLPESRKNGYQVTSTPLSENVQMISGRTVREYRGSVWNINYQYGYFSTEDMNAVIAACEKGLRHSIDCSFLVQGEEEHRTSKFIVEKYTRPIFAFARKRLENGETVEVPVWLNFSVSLREVKPHD